MARFIRISYRDWSWGRLQWGHEIEAITEEAEAELAKAKEENPHVDFEQLARDVREGWLKPL